MSATSCSRSRCRRLRRKWSTASTPSRPIPGRSDLECSNAWSKTSLVLLSATVTANTPSVPNSYLSCIDCGPPYSGVCGKTDGYLSVPASIPLTVGKTSKESFLPFSIPALSTYSPSGRPGQPCQPAINFTAIDPNARNATSVCTKTWQCNDTNPHLFDHVVCEDPAFWFNLTPPDGEVGSFGVANFVLRVHHELPYGRNSTNGTLVTILGESPIKVGDQLAGECGASGVCFWALNGSALALPINSV